MSGSLSIRMSRIFNRKLFSLGNSHTRKLFRMGSVLDRTGSQSNTMNNQGAAAAGQFSTGTQTLSGKGVLNEGEVPQKISNSEWKKRLTPEQYDIARQKGTEYPFTGEYVNNHQDGKYSCVCCGAELFSSDKKFDSGSGWPSFFDVIGSNGEDLSKANINSHSDGSHGMNRVEVTCKVCDAHLGHVFPDGPRETGLRYCINSASLNFTKK